MTKFEVSFNGVVQGEYYAPNESCACVMAAHDYGYSYKAAVSQYGFKYSTIKLNGETK